MRYAIISTNGLTWPMLLLGLLGCSGVDKSECRQKYVSKSLGVTIYHGEQWVPVEQLGRSAGLEYHGAGFQAEVRVTFFDFGITQDEYYDRYLKVDTAHHLFESWGGKLHTKVIDEGTREFARKKWRVIRVEEDGSLAGEVYNLRETDYLWYGGRGPITISIRVKGNGDKGSLNDDIECILSHLEFHELTAYTQTMRYMD